MVKAGKHVISAVIPFVIPLGFRPTWAIFMVSNQTTEDTWGTGRTSAIGWSALGNSENNPTAIGATTGVSEIWVDPTASTFVGNVTLWCRTDHGGLSGFALFTSEFTDNGIEFTFSSGYTSGAVGKTIYYIAGDETFEQVATQVPFIPASPALNLGWQPTAMFGLGAGGGVGSPGGVQNIVWANRGALSYVAGGWPNEDADLDLIEMHRSIIDPNVDAQSWFGWSSGFDFAYIMEGQESVGNHFTSIFDPSRTTTTFSGGVADTGGFSSGAARMGLFLLGQTDSTIGSFLPNTTVGVPTQETLPFTPEAVVFFSPGEDRSGVFDATTQGATGIGWVDPAGTQALSIFGGHWNPPNPYQSATLISSQNCWVGNYLDKGVSGTVGTKVNMGTAEINGAGFTHTTTAHAADPGEVWPVLYWAFGPGGDDAPGFFRIIN